MLNLSNLSPHPGSRKQKKRLGRGHGSGHGKTSARGHNGYKSRSGSGSKPGYEGGQMPLQRRLPKRGFKNPFRKEYAIVNLKNLDFFEDGARVDRNSLIEAGMVAKKYQLVKILGNGEISKKVTVSVNKISKGARQKIEAAGGTIEE